MSVSIAFRSPTLRLLLLLAGLLARRRREYLADPQAATELLAVGISPRNESIDPAELAAWTATARAVLNLREAIGRY